MEFYNRSCLMKSRCDDVEKGFARVRHVDFGLLPGLHKVQYPGDEKLAATRQSFFLERYKLIEQVEKYPSIWNKECVDYRNKVLNDGMWDEISKSLKRPKKECKAKWKTLTNTFRTKYFTLKDQKGFEPLTKQDFASVKWIYFIRLLFLKDSIGRRPKNLHNFVENLKIKRAEGAEIGRRGFIQMDANLNSDVRNNREKIEDNDKPNDNKDGGVDDERGAETKNNSCHENCCSEDDYVNSPPGLIEPKNIPSSSFNLSQSQQKWRNDDSSPDVTSSVDHYEQREVPRGDIMKNAVDQNQNDETYFGMVVSNLIHRVRVEDRLMTKLEIIQLLYDRIQNSN